MITVAFLVCIQFEYNSQHFNNDEFEISRFLFKTRKNNNNSNNNDCNKAAATILSTTTPTCFQLFILIFILYFCGHGTK